VLGSFLTAEAKGAIGVTWPEFLEHVVYSEDFVMHYKPSKELALVISEGSPNVRCWEGGHRAIELAFVWRSNSELAIGSPSPMN
jgi:hypothetical protein